MAAMVFLTPRWTDAHRRLRPHAAGEAYSRSPHRFNTVPAGRRSGKTERAKRKLVMRAVLAMKPWAPRYFAGAPTRDQAKRIFWDDLKLFVHPELIDGRPSESDLMIPLRTGAQLWVVGMDKPQRVEGTPWDGAVLDEYANMKEGAWGANVRPALSDRKGWCDLIGVPEGRNHFYELDREARAQMAALGAASEWGAYWWPSSDVIDAAEIAAAKEGLDPLTFDQEYEASFINFEGRAYYPFLETTHTAPLKYDPFTTIAFCFDFNVDPGVAAIVQEQVLPRQFERDANGIALLNQPVIGTGVIGEVHIPRNSNTPAVCRRIVADWGAHKGRVICYGDASGGARGTAKTEGSDWELIRKELRPVFGDRLLFKVKPANPPERSRINAMNTRLRAGNGVIRMMVDATKAPHVLKDLEGVTLLKGGSGEIDKKASPALTHLSDAIGYYVEHDYPVQDSAVRKVKIGGF